MTTSIFDKPAALETVYYSAETSFSMETGYRKTSGVCGLLFGHLSLADEHHVLKQGQVKMISILRQACINLDEVTLLPVQLRNPQARVLSTKQRTSNRLFGGTKTVTYANFILEGTLELGFLSTTKMDIPGFQHQVVASAIIKVKGGADDQHTSTLAETKDIAPQKLSLRAYTDTTAAEEVGQVRLGCMVPQKALYRLGSDVARSLKKQGEVPNSLSTEVVLNFEDDSSTELNLGQASLDMDKTAMLKGLKAKGAGRFFSPYCFQG